MNATPIGDDQDPMLEGSKDAKFPVLRSILSQQHFDDQHLDFAKAGSWIIEHRDDLVNEQLVPDTYQYGLFRSLALDLAHNRVMLIHAAPGCGKTVFTVLLMLAICWLDGEAGVRRLHWMTAPTKTLVTELVQLARKLFPLSWMLPVGNDAVGDDRTLAHMEAWNEELYSDVLEEIREDVQTAKNALEAVQTLNGVATQDERFHEAKSLMRDAYLKAFDHYNGDAFERSRQVYHESVRIVFSTTSYKLKHNAKERGPVNKVKQTGVLPGGHVADEADASSLSTVLASSSEDVFFVAPTDPAQHMQGLNSRTPSRSLSSLPKDQNPNDWLAFADVKALSCTRRFGERGRQLLKAVLPTQYASLTSSPDAPDTTIDYIELGYVEWVSAGDRAGAVVNADVFAAVLAAAEEMLKDGPVMILCIYAATRELLGSFFRSQGFEVSNKSDDENVLSVLTARQIRGGTRWNAIAVFIRRYPWDPDYIASCADQAKIVVLLSRMRKKLAIFAESWNGRINDPLSRMSNHLWDMHGTPGYRVGPLRDFLVFHDKHCPGARDWVERKMWPSELYHDSDDGDECAVDFFEEPNTLYNATQTSLHEQKRRDTVPRWQPTETVDRDLWDHVSSLVFAVTVKAFTINDAAENDDQQGDASDKDSVKAFFDL